MVGMILQMQNKTQEAELQFEAILERHPKAAAAANNLARLYADRGQDLDKRSRWRVRSGAEPEEAQADDTLGWVYYKKGFQSRQRPSSSAASKNNQVMPCPTITWAWPTQQPVRLPKLGASSSTRSSCSLSLDGADLARRTLRSLSG